MLFCILIRIEVLSQKFYILKESLNVIVCYSKSHWRAAFTTPIELYPSFILNLKAFMMLPFCQIRTHFARPNWKKVFTKLANSHQSSRIGNKILMLFVKFYTKISERNEQSICCFLDAGVFYCGSPTLTKVLKNLCQEFSLNSSTRFQFHKENF